MTNISSKIPFHDLCRTCEKIYKSQRNKKVEILTTYISYYRQFGNNLQENDANAVVSFYPVLRLLLPQAERERGPYGVKEPTLAKIYIRILSLAKDGVDAKKLLNFKAPSIVKGGLGSQTGGDFADVAYFVLAQRCPEKGTLTVEDVNRHLDNIARQHAEHQPRAVDDELIKMLHSMTALEQKWLIRMILKDMKLNLGQNKILSLFHVDAPDLFDVCNSLSKVCITLHNPEARLHELEIELFSAFRPMLSERLDIAKLDKTMKPNKTYFIENKFDGERFQLHMMNGVYKYFSRNGYDFSDTFGRSDACGLLTPTLSSLLKSDITGIILDGEMMGWNTRKQCFGSKGMNFDVKNLKSDSVHQPCYCVFDILMLNGQVLTNKPLEERLSILDNAFEECEGVLMHSVRTEVNSMDQVIDALNKSIDNREEGIVMKNPDSVYKPNSRTAGWFKIKPEYTNGVLSELDLLIIGGYYGEGKRKGLITSFLLGVAVSNEPGQQPSTFRSVGKVGIGFTAVELEELVRKLRVHWKKPPGSSTARGARECPPGVEWTKEKPDVWIEPQNSCIVQIKATELVRTTAFKTKYTPRFPRVEKVRYDKPWYDCLTETEYYAFITSSSGVEKLTARHVTTADIGGAAGDYDSTGTSSRKRARLFAPIPTSYTVDASKIKKETDLLEDKEFCVMTGTKDISKQVLEIKIIENGGTLVQNAGPNTFCILAGEVTFRVKNLAGLGTHNVALVSWFLRALESGAPLLRWAPADLVGATEEVKERLTLEYDKYGDSFTQHTTLSELKMCMDKVQQMGDIIVPVRSEFVEIDQLIYPEATSPYAIFRKITTYFNVSDDSISSEKLHYFNLSKNDLLFMGGKIATSINESVTHVIVCPEVVSNERLEEIQKLKKEQRINFFVVSHLWITDSFDSNAIMNERDYIPKLTV